VATTSGKGNRQQRPRLPAINAFTMGGIVRNAGLELEAFRKLL
jgi:hypothetical protein